MCAVSLLILLLVAGIATAEMTSATRVTIECRGHEISVLNVRFLFNGTPVLTDENTGIGCTAVGGDSKFYELPVPAEINGYACEYTADGGPVTTIEIVPSEFFFHIPLKLVCPSPGGLLLMHADMPGPDEAGMVVSDHDVLMQQESECFQFRGGPYDYIAVTWFCETSDPPVYQITPGCQNPCGDPSCPPAIYTGIGYTAPCNPIPHIWCRLFWPIGLVHPGCWCYYFEYQLAVQLSEFSALPEGNAIHISFATASETDNDHFEIWRGLTKEGEYQRVALMNSHGNSATRQSYDFTDHSVTPGASYWYYVVAVDAQNHRVEYKDRAQLASVSGDAAIPATFALSAYPNPFNPTTTIEFALPEAGRVSLNVYDVSGRLIEALADQAFTAGSHNLRFDATNLPTGLYIARMNAGSRVLTSKLLLIK